MSPSPSPTQTSSPGRRLILLLGYWPPTDTGSGILAPWSTLQVNYKNSGYDVLAKSTTFSSQKGWQQDPNTGTWTVPYWGVGTGTLTVDYRDTSEDFWALMQQYRPAAIMSFSRGRLNKEWELEGAARNLPQSTWLTSLGPWRVTPNGQTQQAETIQPPLAGGSNADHSPYAGQGAVTDNPPDPTLPAGTGSGSRRSSNLPMSAIEAALQAQFPSPPGDIVPNVDLSGDVGSFVSEYMAYHVGWYRDYSQNELDPDIHCLRAGHTHVGVWVDATDGQSAVEIQLDELIKVLP